MAPVNPYALPATHVHRLSDETAGVITHLKHVSKKDPRG